MPHIAPLEKHVAELIAAGEVVERPASVVKELVENAMDAGASAIAVSIRRGGMGLIRVSDDGCGIAPEELPTALLRHATSKLRTTEELGRIGTLGFRGEALAAISSVSRMELLSRERGRASGAVVRCEGGAAGEVQETGAPEGTTVTVRDLFFNTPARLKFMRKDSAETAAVAGLVQHLALSRPDIAFKFTKDGADALHTPGDGKLLSAIYAVLGREFAVTLIPAEGRGGETTVSGFVTKPLYCRGSRAMQTFFVNGRFIKSQLLTAAVEEAYRNQMMKGKFPGCVLHVNLPPALVDVNVHPAKTQVKFAREHDIFDAVYHTVLDTLNAMGGAVPAPGAARSYGTASGNGAAYSGADRTAAGGSGALPAPARADFYQSMDTATYRASIAGGGRRNGTASRAGNSPRPDRPAAETLPLFPEPDPNSDTDYQPFPEPGTRSGDGEPFPAEPETLPDSVEPETASGGAEPETLSGNSEPFPAEPDTPAEKKRPFVPAIPADALPGQASFTEPPAVPDWRIAGEVLRTYIVCEDEAGNVWLIDKHAAHERVNFDRLQAMDTPPMRQTLLTPVAVEPGQEAAEALLDNLPLLERFGFLCEDFGGGAVLVREVPADLDPEDAAATLEELAEDLRTGRSPDEKREAALRTMACKASIKGGWESSPAELRALVDRVRTGEVRFCPHGRPVAVKLTRYEIEKMFRRA